ncbi:hypothetical protein GCM10010123_03150 [Pilimelia anulata]|uniref:Uncharacterized protein n=1 Tax=Pilimelia anulata TaxID=53371 RepID=A0A8J3B1H8_9ACTN|nr:hypothetical protein [Pilimelia anulata]GGJ76535.1 hypothetical protein GCM10010123_03150 [Pilimelia anulata]
MRRTRAAGLAVLVAATGAAPAYASPAPSPCDIVRTARHPAVARPGPTPRELTQHLAIAAPYRVVRAAALIALQSPRGDEAIREFIPDGWCAATRRAEEDANRYAHIIERVLGAHSEATSPRVVRAARAARAGTVPEQEAFVRDGLERARAADRADRDADGRAAAALREFDRRYVADLRDRVAAGQQVRVAAAWATRAGAGDGDVVEFYAYSWISAARLDNERHRLDRYQQEMRRLTAIQRLQVDARAAQAAAEAASGEAAAALRRRAAEAWGSVATAGTPEVDTWQRAKQVADEQAAAWQRVYEEALRQESINWQPLTGTARDTRNAWRADITNATERATAWRELVQEALDREQDMRPPADR